MKNRRPDLNGVLPLDKPLGWTSADCCRYIRKGTRGAKVGHAGTLDPLASGVLVLCLGRATRLIPHLMDSEKRYLADVDLSRISPTDDLEAPTENVHVAFPPTSERVLAAAASFVGEIMQMPPVHSAVWVCGTRSYHLARKGEPVALAPRQVVIRSIEVLSYDWPMARLDVRCGKGTYIRSLARDLGRALGVGGVLASLRRIESSGFTVDQARDPTTITNGLAEGDLIPLEAISAARGHGGSAVSIHSSSSPG